MIENDVRDVFDIRYIKLHFTVAFTEDTVLQKYKASALRGGMGEMLLRQNCIRDRKCEKCDFAGECLVQRIMYSKMEIQPDFMGGGDSVGYVLECENYREEFDAGDQLDFQVIIFGKTIVYFAQILDAFFRLGVYGVGKNKSRYEIVSVTNSRKEPILSGNDVIMENYRIEAVGRYVAHRLKKFSADEDSVILKFQSPLALKHQGEFVREFEYEAIIAAVKRRLYMLACFEGIETDVRGWILSEGVNSDSLEQHLVRIPRYSNRKNEKMNLEGIEGRCIISGIDAQILRVLLAGELLHIGKNTSFGFGRYHVSAVRE